MKVLLCTQYYGDDNVLHSSGKVFPLGIAYIASMLKGHEVTVLTLMAPMSLWVNYLSVFGLRNRMLLVYP